MDRHLVPVKISIKGSAHEGVKFDRLSFYQNRVKGLNPQAMQGGGPIEQDRMLPDDFFQDIPDLRLFLFHELLGTLDGGDKALLLQLLKNKGLEEFQGHFLRQAALMELELRSHHNDRATRVVYSLTQQILPEPALLAFEHVT